MLLLDTRLIAYRIEQTTLLAGLCEGRGSTLCKTCKLPGALTIRGVSKFNEIFTSEDVKLIEHRIDIATKLRARLGGHSKCTRRGHLKTYQGPVGT